MKPWFWLSPRFAHKIAPLAARALGAFFKPRKSTVFQFRNLNFTGRIGIAGGVDKVGDTLLAWQNLGAGFLELGTITPRAQGPNSGTIIDRSFAERALWNKMGFPNFGAQATVQRVQKIRSKIQIPLFINCGKNRETPLAQASKDYLQVMEGFKDLADGFIINISSPNTQDLRQLQTAEYLNELLRPLTSFAQQLKTRPIVLLKLSPDMPSLDLRQVIDTSLECGVDGWILTNTTVDPQLKRFNHQGGGVSGAPLTTLSRLTLRELLQILGNRRDGKLIVSAGGVMDLKEAKRRLEMGADLVQVYSALIFEGPLVMRKWNGEL